MTALPSWFTVRVARVDPLADVAPTRHPQPLRGHARGRRTRRQVYRLTRASRFLPRTPVITLHIELLQFGTQRGGKLFLAGRFLRIRVVSVSVELLRYYGLPAEMVLVHRTDPLASHAPDQAVMTAAIQPTRAIPPRAR